MLPKRTVSSTETTNKDRRMLTLGLNAYHGDASAAILKDGVLAACIEEERFTRVKHWAGLPERSIAYCLDSTGAESIRAVDTVCVSRDPGRYLWRKAALALRNPAGLPTAWKRVRNIREVGSLGRRLAGAASDSSGVKVVKVEHHLAHAASAFFCSPFEEAAVLTVDGFGDFVSTMLLHGTDRKLKVLDRILYPHSLGLFYTAITQFLGFPKYGDEYKVMGLAAYGEPTFEKQLAALVPQERDTGAFALDLRYFTHFRDGVDMTWSGGEPTLGDVYSPRLESLLGPRRRTQEPIEQRHKDLAASLQRVYEQRFFALVRRVLRLTKSKRLALAGGCAMNSLANGRLLEAIDVDDVFVQAAAGDAGTALGAALYFEHAIRNQPRRFVMKHAYWGPCYSDDEHRAAVSARIAGFEGRDGEFGDILIQTARSREALLSSTAAAIAAGEVVGWFQGRSEWGPRALGNRSILADPRRPDIRQLLNTKIKRRESFRPFAPSILEEETAEWFTLSYPDPFMIKVYPIRPERRALIPAVTHADGTGRLQTVSRETNPLYWDLIREFQRVTQVPALLNTSFNENEPIVNTPGEALDCFLRTRMDRLVLGSVILTRQAANKDA